MEKNKIGPHSYKDIVDQHLIDRITAAYNTPTDYADHSSLRSIAEAFSMTPLKVRKLLITAGAFSSPTSRAVARLYAEGKSISEIEEHLNLSYASIHAYLPYSKVVYKTEKVSRNAQRIRIYRRRQQAVEQLKKAMKDAQENNCESISIDKNTFACKSLSTCESTPACKNTSVCNSLSTDGETLDTMIWNTLLLFQNYSFNTASGFNFIYIIKENEMLIQGCINTSKYILDTLGRRRIAKVSRRIRYAVASSSCPTATYRQSLQRNIYNAISFSRGDKIISRATVILASRKVIALQLSGDKADEPKKVETYGADYLYPIFRRMGVIRSK